ncbi:MAG: DUF6157 family protein [Methylocella sp.]
MSYQNTFIQVAEDCRALTGVVPSLKTGMPTVARLEYELLSKLPYTFTQNELIVAIYARRNNLSAKELNERGTEIRAELFKKPHPCMRASPLPKIYGWGVHHNENGRIAIFAVDSGEYARLSKSTDTTVLKAMRSKRA